MHARGMLYAVLANLVFAGCDTVVKLLSTRHPVFQIITMQACVASVVVLLIFMRGGYIAKRSGLVHDRHVRNPKLLALRGLLAGIGSTAGLYAFSLLPLADVYAITFASPLLVTLASVLILREEVGIRRWAAVIAGLIGILIMVRPGYAAVNMGHIAAFISIFVSTAVVLIMRSIGATESRNMMVGAVLAGQLMAGIPGTFLWFSPPSAFDIGLVVVGGLLNVAAQFLFLEALRLAPASSVAPMQYTKLVWALIVGALLFGDLPTVHMLLGAAIVIASVLYMFHRERKRGVAPSVA
ncbi:MULTISPECIES: DMT family transporter [unclassified Chelatococcus]|uniref:DMT family transporter n=1 Tax=unclassified Chelatococcus TaxID=2638111 RepID=UPI001BCB3033|nr:MULTISPECIES: DMT family transporter [unclassified Chelatococcus]MBS7695805.1 DMT family transporter [Chelatococcus sp. YT9]MBX3555820.1 DMT family transporter [Chelatococcus sp.]